VKLWNGPTGGHGLQEAGRGLDGVAVKLLPCWGPGRVATGFGARQPEAASRCGEPDGEFWRIDLPAWFFFFPPPTLP